MSAAAEVEQGFIDFEVDSELKECLYSDCRKQGPQDSRNNSSANPPKGDGTRKEVRLNSAKARKKSPEFRHGCSTPARSRFEVTSSSQVVQTVVLWICIRKHTYKNYLWQFLHQGRFQGTEAYKNLSRWTTQLRIRMNRRVPFGYLLRGLRSRLGLSTNVDAVKLCLDGFYGMIGFGDIFGNYGDGVVPWMEISNQSTADTLQLHDGDIIFVSCSNEKLESLARANQAKIIFQSSDSTHSAGNIDQEAFNEHNASELESVPPFTSGRLQSDDKRSQPISHNALPVMGTVTQLPMYMAEVLVELPQLIKALSLALHERQPMYIATAAISAESQFCQTDFIDKRRRSKSRDWKSANILEVFTKDGSGLLPGIQKFMHQVHLESEDIIRVKHPNSKCSEGLDLVLSPELVASILDAVNERPSPRLHPLLAEARAEIFRCCSASDVDAADGIGFENEAGGGVIEELRLFASELDSRLRIRCAGAGDITSWSPDSAAYFVIDTFFATSISTIYGLGRDHRYQPYVVDSAMQIIEEDLSLFLCNSTGSDPKHKERVDWAWHHIYRLHPAPHELDSSKACLHLKKLLDLHSGQRNISWRSFIGCSLSCLYSDYSAKKAAFWAINFLVSQPKVYNTLLAEIDSCCPAKPGVPDFCRLTLTELEEMPFLEAFVKEVYRHTVGQFVCFRANSDLQLQARKESVVITMASGREAGILLHTLNMDPSLFSQPEEFKPHRFLHGSRATKLFALPFGYMWPRRRLGLLKLKLFLFLLLSQYKLRAGQVPTAQSNDGLLGVEILPWTEDFAFEIQPRG